jgi:hypothetical protein
MRKVLSTAVVAVVLVMTVAPASAQTGRHHAEDTVVVTDGTIYPLVSVRIRASKGDTFYVNARLQTRSARQDPTHRMLVALLLGCADGVVEVRSTQNIDYGTNVLAHKGRYLFTAPHDGEFECRLQSRGGIHGQQSSPPARFTVDGANTYISVSGTQPAWVRHRYVGGQRLVRTGTARDLVPLSFTAPVGVSRFSVTADIEMTNCYNAGYLCDTIPRNFKSSTAGTRLVVMQKARNGGYCRTHAWPASGPRRTKVTWAEHHQKTYHRMNDIPVSAAARCTRSFRIKVYTRVLSGNDMLIEAAPYTNAFVWP